MTYPWPTLMPMGIVVISCVRRSVQPSMGLGFTGDPLHSRALSHSRAPLFTQPCRHCSHSRAPGEQWARLCVFTLQGCVQAARLCRGSPVGLCIAYKALGRNGLQFGMLMYPDGLHSAFMDAYGYCCWSVCPSICPFVRLRHFQVAVHLLTNHLEQMA